VLALVILAVAAVAAAAWVASPSPSRLATSVDTRLHATTGKPVDPSAIPPILREAVVSTEDERRARLMLPDRSEVLAAGVLILRETLRHLELDAIEASEHDLLDGAALAAAELPEPDEGDAPPGAYTCC